MKWYSIGLLALLLACRSYAGGAITEAIESGLKAASRNSAQDARLLALGVKDTKFALQKSEVDKLWKRLQEDAKQLKASDPTYHAPWEPAAKRVDWQARDVILKAQKPLSVVQIACKLNETSRNVEIMLNRDQGNMRKVFFKMSDGTYWVSSSKLPSRTLFDRR